MLRSDRGPEFTNACMKEFVSLMGMRHRVGTAWRPMEQGMVERVHQEVQKILSLLLHDVAKCHPEEWSELLPVVEFVIYNTPGPHGFTPRDIDRRWSLALPLEKELQPFQVGEFEPVTEYAANIFRTYREIKAKVLKHYKESSEKRAELANRFRNSRHIEPGTRVVYRDPRQKAAGGRTPWKQPLSEPCIVEEVQGNKAILRLPNGTTTEGHLEDVVVVPESARDLESVRAPIQFDDDDDGSARSLGQMLEDGGKARASTEVPGSGKLSKVRPGSYIAYVKDVPKRCSIGKVTDVDIPMREILVHRHIPISDGRLRVLWKPVYWKEGIESWNSQPQAQPLLNVSILSMS